MRGIKTVLTVILPFARIENVFADWNSAAEAFERGDYKDAFWTLDPLMAGVIFSTILVLAFIVLFSIQFGRQKDQKKLVQLTRVASTMGLTAQLVGRVPREIDSFELQLNRHAVEFSFGEIVQNLMYGNKGGVHVLVFDRDDSHAEEDWIFTSAVLFCSPAMNLPKFYLRPHKCPSLLFNILEKLEFQDIVFPEYPIFSDHYRLTGDKQRTSAVFTNHVIEHFSKNLGWSLEGNRKMLLVYKYREQIDIEAYPTFVEEGFAILRFFSRW